MHLVCGEALYDIFANEGGSERPSVLEAIAGGSPFNVAVGMARLGAKVGLASDIAKDVLGDCLAAQLASEGVADNFLRRSSPVTAFALVSTDDTGKPDYKFSGLDQAVFCPTSEMIISAGGTITGIHLGSIAAVLPNSARSLLDLAERFADRALLSFDPNIRLSVIPEVAAWRSAINGIRPFCTLVKASEEDIAALYGDVDPEAICRSWVDQRTVLVVLTRGATGAVMFGRTVGRIEIPPAGTTVVDTVGAGDSFMAALLTTLVMRGLIDRGSIMALSAAELAGIGSIAALAAAVTCSRRGPMLPKLLDLQALGATLA